MIRSTYKNLTYLALLSQKNLFQLHLPPINYKFSTQQHDKKIKRILSQINIDIKNKKINIFNSGIISNYKYDQLTNKIIIQINNTKDYPKLKYLIKQQLGRNLYGNVQIYLKENQQRKIFQRNKNLRAIKNIVAVSSCKGGVGKSTVAVNIAFELQMQGFKVGIFDADIYGPSLPTLIKKEGEIIKTKEEGYRCLLPIEVNGVKCISFGFLANKPAIFRGPMASSIVSQLLLQSEWGDLDFLIVDMPPGTGDINLTVCQQLKFDGAIIVTTPQKLSFMDVLKGIQMFQDLRVRIIGIVENMSYYICKKCGTVDQIFGKGHSKVIIDQFGIDNLFKIPLVSQVSISSDQGVPVVVSLSKDQMLKQKYSQICRQMIKQLKKQRIKGGAYYNTGERMIIVEEGTNQKRINPLKLRLKCKCFQCVNEITGQTMIKQKEIDPDIYPVKIVQKGNYAVGVVWSDGHKNSIYSFKRLLSDQIPTK